jgi:hypothetical protein
MLVKGGLDAPLEMEAQRVWKPAIRQARRPAVPVGLNGIFAFFQARIMSHLRRFDSNVCVLHICHAYGAHR